MFQNAQISPLLLTFLLISFSAFSQGVAINADGSSPSPATILDIKSADQGLLFPRLTSTEMYAISVPAAGLQIYNTSIKCMFYYMVLVG